MLWKTELWKTEKFDPFPRAYLQGHASIEVRSVLRVISQLSTKVPSLQGMCGKILLPHFMLRKQQRTKSIVELDNCGEAY